MATETPKVHDFSVINRHPYAKTVSFDTGNRQTLDQEPQFDLPDVFHIQNYVVEVIHPSREATIQLLQAYRPANTVHVDFANYHHAMAELEQISWGSGKAAAFITNFDQELRTPEQMREVIKILWDSRRRHQIPTVLAGVRTISSSGVSWEAEQSIVVCPDGIEPPLIPSDPLSQDLLLTVHKEHKNIIHILKRMGYDEGEIFDLMERFYIDGYIHPGSAGRAHLHPAVLQAMKNIPVLAAKLEETPPSLPIAAQPIELPAAPTTRISNNKNIPGINSPEQIVQWITYTCKSETLIRQRLKAHGIQWSTYEQIVDSLIADGRLTVTGKGHIQLHRGISAAIKKMPEEELDSILDFINKAS